MYFSPLMMTRILSMLVQHSCAEFPQCLGDMLNDFLNHQVCKTINLPDGEGMTNLLTSISYS